MSTFSNISLTSSDGTAFTLDANKVIYATDNLVGKAELTFENDEGVNDVVTLTIDIIALQGFSTNILFLQDVYPIDGDDATFITTCFCGSRAIKLIPVGVFTSMYYNTNSDAVTLPFRLDGDVATVLSQTKTSIDVTDSTSDITYAINGFNVGNITSVSDTGEVLDSTLVATAGTLMIPNSTTLTLTGGTYGVQATAKVATTKVVTKTIVSGGTLYLAGDIVTVSTGTATPHATIHVDTVDGVTGAITGSTLVQGGVYTSNPTLTAGVTTTNSVAGSGATVTVVMGADTVTPLNKGQYSAVPANPVSTTGGNNDATLTATWASGTVTGCQITYNDPSNPTFELLDVQETKTQIQTRINAL